MTNKKIYKNRLSLPIFDNKGMGNGNGVAYVPNIIRGGSAIPIGNNMFFMKGKSHSQGGIDIGKDLEVERNEVVQNGKFGTRVFSSVPFLRGVSPAERVLQGENPDAVFAAQENWKRINKINDDGSRKARKGKYVTNPNVAQSDNTRVAPILNNTPKSKEIRQGDFVYTPAHLELTENGFETVPASRRTSMVPLRTIHPEFDAFVLPRVAANYATSPILQLERELSKGLRNIKVKNKTLTPTKYDVRDNVTLYRSNPSIIKNPNYKGERYGDNSGRYVGKWFTDDAGKINWYASNAAKKGEVPLAYKTTMPRYYAEKQKAAYKITNKNIEFEPEDYILEDGVKGLVGREFKGRPGTVEYITQSFPNDLRSKDLKNIFDIKNDIDFYNAANEFANKYGYETFDKSLINNRKALEDAVKQMLNRHNTFYRGVVGDDATKRIAVDSPWKEGEGIWISPQADYAHLYGQVGKLQRPYTLSDNRMNWFKDADFDYTFADDNVGLINPWQRNPKLYENTIIDKSVPHEIYAKDKLNFVDWVEDIKNAKGSNNIMNYKKFGGRKAALGLSLFRPNSFRVQELPIDSFLANSINREIEKPEVPTYVLKDDEKPVGKKVNPNIIGGGRLYNGYAVDNHEGENVNGIGGGRVYTAKPIDEFATDSVSFGDIKSPRGFKEQDADYIYDYLSKHSDLTDTAKAAILATAAFESGMNPRAKNKYSTAKGYFQWLDDRYIPTPGLSDEQERIAQLNKIIDDMTPVKGKAKGWTQTKTRNIFDLANEFRTTDDIDRAVEIITRHHIRPSLGEEPRKNKQGVEVDKGYKWEIAERRKVAKQFYNRMFNRKNKKEFGGEDKVYIPPKWAQDSYKKYGKVVIGGEPLGIGLGAGRVGTFTGLMRNNLLRSAFRNFKKYGSKASTIIKDSYYDLTDALAKPFIRSEKAHKTFKKVRGIGYDTFFGDRRLDGTVKTGKGDFEFFSNLSRLPITFNETNNIINGEKQFGGMKLNIFKLGGLSRSKDYGSKDKPYPSVNKNDFAGGGRSYPIPTRADAVDALRLAGLHHRSDVRAKVYAKYPDLRKKAFGGPDLYNVVKKGDTLSKIAKRNGISLPYLIYANPQITNPDLIQVGDTIDFVVPKYRYIMSNKVYKDGHPEIEYYNSRYPDKTRKGHLFDDYDVNTTRFVDPNDPRYEDERFNYKAGGLRNKAKLGKYAKITGSPTSEQPSEPVRTNYVEKNNSSDNLGVGIGTILGGGATLSGLGYAGNKLYDKVLEYNSPTAKKAREYSKFLEKRAADKRAVAKAIADRQETLNNTYGKRLSKELNKSIKKGFSVTPSQPAYTEKSLYTLTNAKKYVPSISEFSPAIKRGVQKFNNNALNLAKRLGTPIKNVGKFLGRNLPALTPFTEAVNVFFPSKEDVEIQKRINGLQYVDEKGNPRVFKFGGRKKAPYGDYVTKRDDSENIIDYVRKRRWRLPFEEDEQTAINRAWDKVLQYIDENPNPGDLAVNQYEEHPLFRGFYHRENRPMYLTNPLVSRFYNYGWSHNAGAEVPYLINSANVNNVSNTSTPVQTSTSKQVAKTAARKNNIPTVSPAAQRILDNAELAPYQNFSHPTLAEVAGRYPISERVGSSASVTPISSSTGVQPNPADVEAVRSGNFKAIDNDRYVPIHTTTEDWVGLGANLLGSIGSYLGTRAMLNRYPMPSKPVPAIAQKLKTRININPQLDAIREQAGSLNRAIDNNTANSRTALSLKQRVSNNAVASKNQLYGQKENAEIPLINQDRMNRQQVGLYNNRQYNDWIYRTNALKQYLAEGKIGNFNNVLSNTNQAFQDLFGRIEGRNAIGRNLILMQAAYPNVNWRNIFQNNRELARSAGFRFLNN